MMEHRQQILVAVLALMLVYFGGDWLWRTAVEAPLSSRHRRIDRLQDEIRKRERDLARARKDVRELASFEEQSLPSDPQVARSLYQAWLLKLVGDVGFANPNVDSGEPANRKGLYQSITFTVQGRGTLAQLTKFLYEFYRAGHLDQIRSLVVTPMARGSKLDLSLSIEALVLPMKEPKQVLSQSVSNRLAFATLADYGVIPRRNLFGSSGASDPTDHTYLTSIQSINGQPEVWFTLRTEDKVVKLKPGESLQVGQFSGKLLEVDDEDVVLESEGQRWLLSLGDSLAQAFALPPEY
jgi:hypothetical protein